MIQFGYLAQDDGFQSKNRAMIASQMRRTKIKKCNNWNKQIETGTYEVRTDFGMIKEGKSSSNC